MVEGVYLISLRDGKIVYTNPKFEKMFGYETGEMIGKDVVVVNAPGERSPEETAQEITEILNKTGEWHGEVENIKKDGTRFFSFASCSILDHAEYGKVIVAVHTDITERKKMEEELRLKNKTMETKEQEMKKALENSEKANKLMVGRELKMMELKKEIAGLKDKLGIKQ
jgi:PAS domain S-box-containing protein